MSASARQRIQMFDESHIAPVVVAENALQAAWEDVRAVLAEMEKPVAEREVLSTEDAAAAKAGRAAKKTQATLPPAAANPGRTAAPPHIYPRRRPTAGRAAPDQRPRAISRGRAAF